MSVILKHCNDGAVSAKNTGAKKQCLEGLTDRMYAAKKGFMFATVADFEDKAKWLEAIAEKNIVPLYKAYELTPENTEATVYETGDFVYETAPAVKKTSFESYLGFCSHRALKSYNNSTEYTQIFESTNKGEFIGVSSGLGVKGQELSSLRVGIRNAPTKDKPAFTKVSLTYNDYNELEDNPVVIKTGFLSSDLDGIYDVKLALSGTPTATSIKFTASVGCTAGEDNITSLTAPNVILTNAAGVTQTVSFVAADANGVYELTGTAFANGFILSLNGVVTIVNMAYEAEAPLTIAGIV